MKKSKAAAPPKPAALTEKELAARNDAALARVGAMDDPGKIRNLIANADRMGVGNVRDAAFRRLATVLAEGEPGSVEHDFWQTIHAFEELLKDERGKTVRLSRTRQKIARVGERKTLADFAEATKETQGFELLMARHMPELTGEAIILRHPDDFDAATRDAATARLEGAGVDVATLGA
ncbi:hypothetical protein [uncultured Jannaschia sp.]|uniref:hypothetical protein n=1 Tax=uncultured Jannaschia sp. TaxID=293347 RepID=UPI002630A058|nr:hypothetical protein [uncultured Jannaschia sp.]